MAGTYTEGTSEVLSGVYTKIKAAVAAITLGTRGVVAYPFTANWGPINELIDIGSAPEFLTAFNASDTTRTANKIYTHAYKGGPKTVKAYRMATDAAAKGLVTLNDEAAAKSLELETLYPSSRVFTAVVAAGTVGTVLSILEDGVKLFSAEATTLDAMRTLIDASDFIRVKSYGTALPAVNAGAAFTGGADGDTVTVTEYNEFLEAIEADGEANAFSLDGATDEAIITAVITWLKNARNAGLYITFARGGTLTWDASTSAANTVSKAINYRGVVNVGNGVDGYSAADMAIFIAARIATVALDATLTDEVIPYSLVNKKLTQTVRKVAKQAGTLLFVQDGDNVLIDEGVNTLTVPGVDEKKAMGKIKISNTLDYVVKDLEAFGNEYKKNKSNTQEARVTYAATVQTDYINPLINKEILKTGCYYKVDPEYHGNSAIYKPAIDEAYFYGDTTPVDSIERIYQKLGVNF